MAHEKQYSIVDLMIEKTKAGELTWEATFDETEFETNLKTYSLRIKQEYDFNLGETITITVLGKNGNVIERFDDHELKYSQRDFRPGIEYGQALADIYQLIKRRALGVEQALDDLLSELRTNK